MTGHGQSVSLRTIKPADLPGALDLSSLAGWNQTAQDWAMLLDLAPESCFMIESGGQVAATCTLVCYGLQLAWLGMVLTRPEYRGRGFARSLVEAALAAADARGVRSVMLDATEQGLPLYRKLGFRDQQTIERWARNCHAAGSRHLPGATASAERLILLDKQIYGADRSGLFNSLIRRGGVFYTSDGFLLSRPGRQASFLGPCIAGSEAEAREMIGQCLGSYPAPWYWDLLPANECAPALAQQLGFARIRQLTRMVRGADVPCLTARLWATAGFEIG